MARSRNRPLLSVILPTITGREHWLARAVASIRETVPGAEYLIFDNERTCGIGWNKGIEKATGEYVLLFADDLEAHPGWFDAGAGSLGEGAIPCPRLLNSDGTLQSCGDYAKEDENGTPAILARVPLLTYDLAQSLYPIFPNHYMGDHWISWRAKQWGIPTLVVREMVFTHHTAMEGRIDTLDQDVKEYKRVTGTR